MRLGDQALFYRSQQDQVIVGLLEVSREAYHGPTSADSHWLTCDFALLSHSLSPISLKLIKESPNLSTLALVRRPRLSVMPLSETEFTVIGQLAQA